MVGVEVDFFVREEGRGEGKGWLANCWSEMMLGGERGVGSIRGRAGGGGNFQGSGRSERVEGLRGGRAGFRRYSVWSA